jgi:hypothetical protein
MTSPEGERRIHIALISYGTWQEHGAPPDFLTVRVPHRLDYARIVSVSIATGR